MPLPASACDDNARNRNILQIPHQEIGIQIEEIHGGGSAFGKQQLQVGDDLIGYKFPLVGDGSQQQWCYVSGKQTKEIRKILKGIRRKRDLGARTAGSLHLLFKSEKALVDLLLEHVKRRLRVLEVEVQLGLLGEGVPVALFE